MYGEEDDFLAIMDLRASWQDKEWADLAFGVGLWLLILLLLLVTSPFAAAVWLYDKMRPYWLKFRYRFAEKVRPDGFIRAPTMGQSDLVQEFIEYELNCVVGRETTAARNQLISHIGHMEDELEDLRSLASDVRKLWTEQERPKRREAILATLAKRARKEDREQDG